MSASLANIAVTMSSREIAELTGKEHKHVRRDIEKMLTDLKEDGSKFGHIYQDAYGRDQNEYLLPKDLTITLVAGYRSDLRLKIVRRWMELETVPTAPAVPTSFREALLLAADQQEKIEAQERELAIITPKAAAHDYLASLPGELGVQNAGRELKVGQKWVTDYIDGHGWSCIQGKKRVPAHYGLKMGYVRLVPETYKHPYTGEEMVKHEFRITQKGLRRLAEIIIETKAQNEGKTGLRNLAEKVGKPPFAKKPEPAS
ncbi:Rha family transcriptional regulator [Gluconobacter sp. P1C6_b]|uniref:Rha family transcriptional regulator n=1 Tax=Gluconobacter sp. P1C6_b TaxID=2762619 RepID=UPI001C055F98|nr:Rha family transcriptional regulator [Gluconobacter sp. P1C6_b]